MTINQDSQIFYLIKDILSSFPNKVEENLISSLYRHKLVKDNLLKIFKEEVKQKKPDYKLFSGILIVLFNYLRAMPRVAFFEVIELVNELKYCFYKDKRKNIRRLSAQVILCLFLTLYVEFRLMPMHHKDDEKYIDKFKKVFTPNDILNVIKETDNHYITNFLFQQLGFKTILVEEKKQQINKIIKIFWN